MKSISSIFIAFLLDLAIGDPYHWPHPVKVMGNYIGLFLKYSEFEKKSKRKQRLLGSVLWWTLIIQTIAVTYGMKYLVSKIHPFLSELLSIYFIYACFSVRGLAFESKKVYTALKYRGIICARRQVGMIVGRQTDKLTKEEIVKATIETIAENLGDGFIAPLLYITIFGPIGGMVYKAINTLDSMVAYKTDKYLHLGYWSAKADDIANYIPARLTAALLLVGVAVLQLNFSQAWKICLRDARNHSSPNSGYPESVVAGAFEIQLGGAHYYQDELIHKPTIGDSIKSASLEDLLTMNDLLYVTSVIAVISICIFKMF